MKNYKSSKKMLFSRFWKIGLFLISSAISISSVQGQENQEKNSTKIENVADKSSNPDVKAAVSSIEKFLQALRENDVKGAYQSTTEKFKEATSFHEFKSYLREYPLVSNHRKIDYDYDTVDLAEDHVEIDVILNKNNENQVLDVIVDRIDNEWKIDYIYVE